MSDSLLSTLERNSRDFRQINKRLRSRLDHRTPPQPTTTSKDLKQTWRQFAQKDETDKTPEILTAPLPTPILSLFSESYDDDIGDSTTTSTRYIPPLLRNFNLEGPSSLETPVSTCPYQRRYLKSREWPNVSRGKKPLSWSSSPATAEARGSREGLITAGKGQDAETERRDSLAGDDIENKSLSRGNLENVKKRLWSTMFEAVEARINRTSTKEAQVENENVLNPRWHLSRRGTLNEGSSSVVGSSPHPFPPIPRKRSVTMEETSRRTGAVKAHLAMGK